MKKSKVLIATLALSAALMGTGYAYWTKTLTVDATVTSAKFDVFFSDASFETTAADTTAGIDNSKNEVKNAGTINDKGDNIKYEWNNIYPGSKATLKFKINNGSTIPIHAIPVIEANCEDAAEAKDSARGIGDALVYTVKINNDVCGEKMTAAQMKDALGAIDAKIDKATSVPVEVLVEMPTTVTDLAAEGDKVTLKATMVWGQFNDGDPKDPEESPAPTSPAPTSPAPTSPAPTAE